MTSRLVSIVSLLAISAAACGSEERSATVVEAATHLSGVNRHFIGASSAADAAAAIRADLANPACARITATANQLQATFDGCVSLKDQVALDGTLSATITAQAQGAATVHVSANHLVAGSLDISGTWQIDVAAGVTASATWSGDLVVIAAGGSAEAHVSVDLDLVGLCLKISLDADATLQGSSASADASVSIEVNGLLSCAGACPSAGLVHISIDGAASVGWNYGGGGLGGGASGSVDISIGLSGFGCTGDDPQN
jgi:hypothetical protein